MTEQQPDLAHDVAGRTHPDHPAREPHREARPFVGDVDETQPRVPRRHQQADEAQHRPAEYIGVECGAGREPPLVRGDELARELGIRPGPALGDLLAQLDEDRYAGVIHTREDAIRRARELAGR